MTNQELIAQGYGALAGFYSTSKSDTDMMENVLADMRRGAITHYLQVVDNARMIWRKGMVFLDHRNDGKFTYKAPSSYTPRKK